jgi:ankyrin repeat protein
MKKIIFAIILAIATLSLNSEASNINQQLYDAANELNFEKVQSLLNSGANPNWLKVSERRSTSVSSRATYGLSEDKLTHKKLMKIATILFKKGAKLGPHDKDILYMPIANGSYELTQLYLKHGASPTIFPASLGIEKTPIEVAAENGHDDIQKLLVQHGAMQLDSQTIIQLQFINKASFGTVPELENLIKKGARVNAKNRVGQTALLESIPMFFSSFAPIFFYLLDIGADVNLEAHDGYWISPPLHVAISRTTLNLKNDKAKPEKIKLSKKILNSLITAGAYVSSRDELGKTPLHIAAKGNNLYAAQLLLNNNAKVMPRDGKGNTPLDYAKSGEMIKLLKDHGAKEF